MKSFFIKVRGFTLIELLVVVAIIATLASIVFVSLNAARTKSRDARRISDLKSIQGAIENYYADNGHYPDPRTLGAACNSPAQQVWSSWSNCWGPLFTSALFPTVPVDPTNYDAGNCATKTTCHIYAYCIDSGAYNYVLGVNLENAPAVSQSNPSLCTFSAAGSKIYWISN